MMPCSYLIAVVLPIDCAMLRKLDFDSTLIFLPLCLSDVLCTRVITKRSNSSQSVKCYQPRFLFPVVRLQVQVLSRCFFLEYEGCL